MTVITADIEVDPLFDSTAEIAREVLRDVLGDFFSQEDEEFHSAAWEASNGRPLKRAWESWSDYAKRKREFKSARPARSYFMDTASAQQSLARIRTKDVLTRGDIDEMHSLEDMLDIKRTDVEALFKPKESKVQTKDGDVKETFWHRKVTKQEDDISSLLAFEKIEEQGAWVDRVKLVQVSKDHGALQLVAMRDNREEVRESAAQRIMELEIAGK